MKLKEKNKFRDVPIFSNIKEVIYNSVKLYKNNVAFVTKVKKEDKKVEYINHTYQNLLDDVNSFGTSLYKLGLKGKRIAICGRNRYEWAVAHISNLFGGIVSVPIDKELQLNELEDSLIRAKVDAIVFDEKYEENIATIKQNGKTNIHNFICMGNIDKYIKFDDLLQEGKKQIENGNDEFVNNEVNAEKAILHHKEGVDLIPANLDLSAIEFSLVNAMSREFTLKNSIRDIKDNYDYILIDCMPSLGMITINALACSNKIIIPVQGEYLAAKGMGHLLKTVTRVQKQINPNLKIGGVLLTLVDKRTNLSKDVRANLIDNYGQYVKIYGTEIPKAINTAKSTSTGKSIFEFDKNSPVANAYNNLAKEVLDNERTRQKDGTSKVR